MVSRVSWEGGGPWLSARPLFFRLGGGEPGEGEESEPSLGTFFLVVRPLDLERDVREVGAGLRRRFRPPALGVSGGEGELGGPSVSA